MTQRIQLSQGKWALVDDEDYEALCQWRWSAQRKGRDYDGFYAVRMDRETRRLVPLHRQIMNAPKGKVVDHINGDGLDNRRANLRVCTQGQNTMNRGVQKNKLRGRYKGVTWHGGAGKWVAKMGQRGGYIGLFRCETAAALAYDRAAKAKHGEYAQLNLRAGG